MKKLAIILTLSLALVIGTALILSAQHGMHGMIGVQDPEYYGSTGMMGHGMMGYGMMMGNMGCPTMINYLGNVDFYLSFEDELELTNNQIDKLKEIRETYQRNAISKSSDLMEKMFELNSILREDEISLSKLKEVNKEIEEIQTDLRYNNLEGYVKARNILNEEQLNNLRTMLFRSYPGVRPCMMR